MLWTSPNQGLLMEGVVCGILVGVAVAAYGSMFISPSKVLKKCNGY